MFLVFRTEANGNAITIITNPRQPPSLSLIHYHSRKEERLRTDFSREKRRKRTFSYHPIQFDPISAPPSIHSIHTCVRTDLRRRCGTCCVLRASPTPTQFFLIALMLTRHGLCTLRSFYASSSFVSPSCTRAREHEHTPTPYYIQVTVWCLKGSKMKGSQPAIPTFYKTGVPLSFCILRPLTHSLTRPTDRPT